MRDVGIKKKEIEQKNNYDGVNKKMDKKIKWITILDTHVFICITAQRTHMFIAYNTSIMHQYDS